MIPMPQLTADGRIDGRPPDRVGRTHCAELWFAGDRVYKRKRPVDLGFLDFTSLEARRAACDREVELNRRTTPDVYLGVLDIHDDDGRIVDAAVAMRRLPDERRLSTLASAGADLRPCVRAIARQVAVFHASELASVHASKFAGIGALRTNWDDNLAVLRRHPALVSPDVVDEIAVDVARYLDGRRSLIQSRIAGGLVRDGHGDLQAGDIFCLDDGPRVLDCLEFAERYRIADVLLDAAFLAMDLERLGRIDLAREFLEAYREFTDAHHPQSLNDHFIAYRASVRAKVACLSATADATGEQARALAALAREHLRHGRVRMILVGGLPGTGKSTLSAALSDRHGWALLRTDEVRKDLIGIGHRQRAGPDAYRPDVTASTYNEVLDRAEYLLSMGESVILDASWSSDAHRLQAAGVADRTSSSLTALRGHVAPDTARARLACRADDPSDATPAVYDTMRERFASWPDATIIDTSSTVEHAADTAGLVVLADHAP